MSNRDTNATALILTLGGWLCLLCHSAWGAPQAPRAPQAPPVDTEPISVKPSTNCECSSECTCGCQEGGPCSCTQAKTNVADKRNCGCGGPNCECGDSCDCHRGVRNCSGGCPCEQAIVQPQRLSSYVTPTVYQQPVYQQPLYQQPTVSYGPVMNYTPTPQYQQMAYQPMNRSMVFSGGRRGGSC